MKPSILDLVYQDKIWYSQEDGFLVRKELTELDELHLQNLFAWLIRHAEQIKQLALASLWLGVMSFSGEMARDSLETEISRLEETKAEVFLLGTPLLERLAQLINMQGRQLTSQ